MPTCQNCHRKWTWMQTFKKAFTLDDGMYCPYCEVKQYVTPRASKKAIIIPFIILTLVMTSSLFLGPSLLFLVILIAAIPLILIMYPFLVKLSNESKPMW